MSSSQGVNATTVSGYPFQTASISDSSEWTRFKRESRKFNNYKVSSPDNKDTGPVWMKFGNNFRLGYSFGRFKCQTPACNANAFNGPVGEQTVI